MEEGKWKEKINVLPTNHTVLQK